MTATFTSTRITDHRFTRITFGRQSTKSPLITNLENIFYIYQTQIYGKFTTGHAQSFNNSVLSKIQLTELAKSLKFLIDLLIRRSKQSEHLTGTIVISENIQKNGRFLSMTDCEANIFEKWLYETMETFIKNPHIQVILKNQLNEREMIQIYISHSIHKTTNKPIALVKLSIISEDLEDNSDDSIDLESIGESAEFDSISVESSRTEIINWSAISPKMRDWACLTDSSDDSCD
tara:strand:- start:10499 stop:11197 length:699 start_codon:yes stop_codon:yes gene_type:complete